MADFSRLPKQDLENALKQGYLGIYFEQGVPILDRDLNLLQSLVAENVRSIVRSYIGDGVPATGSGFEVKAVPADNDFVISAGKCLVDGIEISLEEDLKYSQQRPAPAQLKTPPAGGTRTDTVYVEVALQTVEGSPGGDPSLLNAADVGVQTSVRLKRTWTVRVAEGGQPPPATEDRVRHTLATIARPAGKARIEEGMIADLRRTGLSLDDVESRMREIEELRTTPTFLDTSLVDTKEFDPESGAAGLEVELFGRNFDLLPIEVCFDDHPTAPPSIVETNRLKVRVPAAHPGGNAVIKVTTGDGAGKREGRSAGTFRVLTDDPKLSPPPLDLDPKLAAEGVTVTLEGSSLNTGLVTVTFGQIEVPETGFVSKKPNRLEVKVPPGLTPQPVNVTVKTSGGTATTQSQFTLALKPVFDAAPFGTDESVVLNGKVTLKGRHFTGVQAVTFTPRGLAPVPVARFDLKSDTEIETKAPVKGLCTVTVTTPGGQVSSPKELKVLQEN